MYKKHQLHLVDIEQFDQAKHVVTPSGFVVEIHPLILNINNRKK
jgi:hypothetical protein